MVSVWSSESRYTNLYSAASSPSLAAVYTVVYTHGV